MSEIKPGWRWVPSLEGRYVFDEQGRVAKLLRDKFGRECLKLLMCRKGQVFKLKHGKDQKKRWHPLYVTSEELVAMANEETVVFLHTDDGKSASSPGRCLLVLKFSEKQIEAWDDLRNDRGVCRNCKVRGVCDQFILQRMCKICGPIHAGNGGSN